MLKKLKPKEAPLEKRALAEVTKRGGKLIKIIAVGLRGFPDRVLLMPGFIMFLEFKKPTGGVISPHQEKWHRILTYFGFVFMFVLTDQDLNIILSKIDIHMSHLLAHKRAKEKKDGTSSNELP